MSASDSRSSACRHATEDCESRATSGGTSYGISKTGKVYAWGGGKEGQIGNGTTESSFTPVMVASGATGISATADDVLIAVTGS